MNLLRKYPNLISAVERPEAELRVDLKQVQALIAVEPSGDGAVRLGGVEQRIGQALRMRTPGLNGPLAWAGRSLVVRTYPQLPLG